MRTVVIRGTPPVDWLQEAEEVNNSLRAAAKEVFTSSSYEIKLLPKLTNIAQVPSTGIAVVFIAEIGGTIQIRVFNSTGECLASISEPEDGKHENPLFALREYLTGNIGDPWNDTLLQRGQIKDILNVVTQVVQDHRLALIIEKNQRLWRDDRVRNWLLNQFSNKCWYSEAQDSVSAIHVDHYRPKGRVKDDISGAFEKGYWWLAFQYSNYRICGELLNVKKADVFPFSSNTRGNADDSNSLEAESPILIDPVSEFTCLISFRKDSGDECIAVPIGDASLTDKTRVDRTIEILGLNRLRRLNLKRAQVWDACLAEINRYKNAESQSMTVRNITYTTVKLNLKKMIKYEAEFSSVAEACITMHASLSLKKALLE